MKTKSTILTLFFISIYVLSFSQKREHTYTASNGITYNEGDTIKMGRGSGLNGSFVYTTVGGWAAYAAVTVDSDISQRGQISNLQAVIIKKINSYTRKGVKSYYFIVGGGNISNYNLEIENSIATCEVLPCNSQSEEQVSKPDKFDQLKKLKELFDSGALNQEEYDKEKAKILNEN